MHFSPEERAIIALHLVPGIGPRRFQNLLARFGTAVDALAADATALSAVEDMTAAIAAAIQKTDHAAAVDRECRLAEKAGALLIPCAATAYPAALRTLQDYPLVLSVRGDARLLDAAAVAMVGTRRPTAYGKMVATRFAEDFAHAGCGVVSGLARGIDTAAHAAALAAGGVTIAVLGTGIGCHYPPENGKLEDQIAGHGAVVSEFPIGFPPDKGNFPRRNRIIAGLALATVVVEADMKSGALITARYAAEQGTDVFAVPGPVFSAYAAGPHSLIKAGAHLAECADDVLQAIAPLATLRRPQPGMPDAAPAVTPQEAVILAALAERYDGSSIDALVAQLSVAAGDLAACLLNLELQGLVKSLPGNRYIRNRP
jgi:DNA processing protein